MWSKMIQARVESRESWPTRKIKWMGRGTGFMYRQVSEQRIIQKMAINEWLLRLVSLSMSNALAQASKLGVYDQFFEYYTLSI